MRKSALVACVLTLLPMLTVAGCAHPLFDAPLESLPEGVSIDVYQTRMDYSERQLEVSITNNSAADVTLTYLEFDSPAFVSAVSYDRLPSTIAVGRTIDFRVQLADPDCTSTDATPLVRVEFESAGRSGTASVTPVDRLDRLPTITTEDCLESDIAAVARVEFADVPLARTTVAGRTAAQLTLEIEPLDESTGAGEAVTLHSIDDTVLLFLLDTTTGLAIESLPLGLEIASSSAPHSITVTVVPSRCDQHSVADDKRGTIFPIPVTTPLREGVLFVPTGERLRSELFAFLADECGWG